MPTRRWFCCALIIAVLLKGTARADDPDDSLRLYAVHIKSPRFYASYIHRTPEQSWTGYGVYLGNGLVITAAHVVGWAFFHKPRVEIAGLDLPAHIVKEGSVNDVDVTLVSVDEDKLPVWLRLRRMTLCQGKPFPGERVIVATPEGIARSRVMAPSLLPAGIPAKFHTVISDVATTGNSGSGVFDANGKCLLGIISRKIWQLTTKEENGKEVKEQHDVAKYFVPASTIAEFLPALRNFSPR